MNSCTWGTSLQDFFFQTWEKCRGHIYDNTWAETVKDTFLTIYVHSTLISLPPQKLKFENHLLHFELLYRDVINDERKDDDPLMHLKSKIKDVGLSSFRLYNKKDHRFENLTEDEYEAFLNLKSSKNMIIQKADKGNSFVVIDRLKYVHKMEELLSDRSKFVKIEFNSKHTVNQDIRHLLDMELEIKSCLDNLLNKNYLSKDDYKYLKPCGSKPGIMYGLCKIHKGTTINNSVAPFWPILSAIGTCNYNIAKFFVPMFKQFIINEYTVKNYFSFCKGIIDQDPNLFMASFNILWLFTNIPLDETINICVDLVFHKKKKVKGMLKQHFKQLLTLSVKSFRFLFNDVYYKQVDGVAMGSPLGPTFVFSLLWT